MIRMLFIILFACISFGTAIAAPQKTFLSTENNLWFPADVVNNAIVEHVAEDKQQAVADVYQDLMDYQTGRISVASLFKVCEKAGFKTKRLEGYTACKQFIEQMLTDAEIASDIELGGFCPGLDANGNNPNSLRSITDKTRVGDMCSSTNIAYGEVVFKTGYACTCLAMQCNSGFRFRQRGDCVIPTETENPTTNTHCVREQYVGNTNNNSSEKCKNLCTKSYSGKNCYWDAVIWDKDQNTCICNPTNSEISAKLKKDEERRKSRKYYNPCDKKDKGKSGGQEFCVDKPFEWVNVTRMHAVELAKLYAKKHNQDEIECADATETKMDFAGFDDFIMCASIDANNYYAFRFDDVKESFDNDIQAGLVNGICKIYGHDSNVQQNDSLMNLIGTFGCFATCSNELKTAGAHFGLSVAQSGTLCTFSQRVVSADNASAQLAKIDGLDNYYFKGDATQIQSSQGIGNAIYGYIESQGFLIRTLDCIPNSAKLQNKWYQDNDDIIQCKLNGRPIDFVFDDVNEAWSYKYEAGEGTLSCLGTGGKYQGNECYGLSQQQCTNANRRIKEINPGSSGARWDSKNSVCILIDQTEAAVYDKAIQVGTSAIAVVDCAVGSHIGCVMFATEMAGLVADISSDVLVGERVKEFLRASTVCKSRNCAKSTIRDLGAKVISVKSALDDNAIRNIDDELSRLILLLEPEDLKSEMSTNDWNGIVAATGGATSDWTGTAIVWMGRIGVVAQFASLGVSGVNLLKKSVTSLKTVLSSVDNVAAVIDDVADGIKALGAADAVSDGIKALGAADDIGDAAKALGAADAVSDGVKALGAADDVSDAAKAIGAADDVADAARAAENTVDAVTDMARSMSYTDELAEVGIKHVIDKNGVSRYLDMTNNHYFTSYDEVLKRIDDIPNALARKMAAADVIADMTNAADDVADAARGAANTIDDIADASKTAGAADDVADAARGAASTIDDVAKVAKEMKNTAMSAFTEYISKMDELPTMSAKQKRKLWATLSQAFHPDKFAAQQSNLVPLANELQKQLNAFKSSAVFSDFDGLAKQMSNFINLMK